MAAGYGGKKVFTSTYFLVAVLMVAMVPKLKQAVSGVVQPAPKISQALSLAAAITGRPLGMPVSSRLFA